jgi:hypothetical protein
MLLFLLSGCRTVSGQVNLSASLGISLEEKIETFFNMFRDGHTHISISRYADYIVYDYGYAVMPFLKERLAKADYFQFVNEPKDIALTLIAYIMAQLYVHSGDEYNPEVPVYEITDNESQWFFDEYMRRIEEYIITKRVIDEVVMHSDTEIIWVTCANTYHKGVIVKFGYPFFGNKPIKYCGNELKQYYEQRLGISGLTVDYEAFEE